MKWIKKKLLEFKNAILFVVIQDWVYYTTREYLGKTVAMYVRGTIITVLLVLVIAVFIDFLVEFWKER